jgi:hypothetical protein
MRRLVTYLVYQSPCFRKGDAQALREALQASARVYFEGLQLGFNALSPRSTKDLIGPDYDRLKGKLCEAGRYRNKIFHGQLSSEYLGRQDLLAYIDGIRLWCKRLANAASAELGYDGFGRNSFQKSKIPGLWKTLRIQIANVQEYKQFIENCMQRR